MMMKNWLSRILPVTDSGVKFVPLDRVRSIEDLCPYPTVYGRAEFMEHIRRYDREELRAYYMRQPVDGAWVWANYVVNLWEYEHGAEALTTYPWNVTIPITEVCNARCSFCSSPLVPDPKATAVQEIHPFSDALRYAVRISLQGLGEPLAHPQFEELVEEIRKHLNPVAQLEIITNGWLLSGRRWELLKSVRISDMQVSVNAATDQTHQIAMGSRPGTFAQVVKNIENVLADPGWPRLLKVSMVVTRHSLAEVSEFLDLFVRKGVTKFQFNALLPLTTPDWGFGRTDQYLDLWCGHLPNARELVERGKKAIQEYKAKGISITASPDQWLLPVDQFRRSDFVQLSVEQKNVAQFQEFGTATATYSPEWEALSVWVGERRVILPPHEKHTEVTASSKEGVTFRGTPHARRWAYLLRTPRIQLPAGEYTLEVDVRVRSGQLYAGILDVEKNDFVIQREIPSGNNRIAFLLPEQKLVDVILRQGEDDGLVEATYVAGQIVQRGDSPPVQAHEVPTEGERPVPTSLQAVAVAESKRSSAATAEMVAVPRRDGLQAQISAEKTASGPPSKSSRIYCPMVYTTLSVFHHSFDVSVCCYMENAPGHTRPNLKDKALHDAYNDAGFRLVRRTLNTDQHIPVCDSCPYGNFRS
ncbi:MAG: radical SAM protein [Acidobacteria bacterium]|nr:radical SAM protein [Acidobacteriota bacterium]